MSSSQRRPRRTARAGLDPRLIVGIALVVLSIAGVWLTVTAARVTTEALVVSRTIVPGEPVRAEDVEVVQVTLGQAAATYLTPGDLPDGAIASRTISRGELLGGDALTTSDRVQTTTVVVRSAIDVPTSIAAGSRVEVWASRPADEDTAATAEVLVSEAVVAAVNRSQGVLAGDGPTLELIIARSEVPAVLSAESDGATLSVVPGTAAAG